MIRIEGVSAAIEELRREVDRAVGAPTRAQRWAAMRILEGTVRSTPVDTGRLRGGWQVGVGSAPGGEPGPRTTDQVVQTEGAKVQQLEDGRYVRIWISNNVEYAEVVEFGGFKPADPKSDPESNKRRAARRTPAQRKNAALLAGDPGAPLVRGGFSVQAPAGMLNPVVERVRQELEIGVEAGVFDR